MPGRHFKMAAPQSEFKLPLYVKKASRDSSAKRDEALAALGAKLGGEWKLEVDIAKDVEALHAFFKDGGEAGRQLEVTHLLGNGTPLNGAESTGHVQSPSPRAIARSSPWAWSSSTSSTPSMRCPRT